MNTPTPAVKCEPTLETQHTSQDAQSVGELHAEYAAHGNVEDVKDEDYDVDDVEDEDPSSDESVASPIGSSAKATFMPEIPAHSMEVDANSPTQEPLEQEALSIAAHEASSVQMQTSDNGQNGPPLEERQAWILISTSNDPVHGYSRSAGPTWTSFSLARDAPIPAQLPGVGDLIFYNKGEKVVGVWRIAPGSDAKRIKADVLDDHMPLVKHLEIDVEWVKGAILGVEQLEPLHRVADGEQSGSSRSQHCSMYSRKAQRDSTESRLLPSIGRAPSDKARKRSITPKRLCPSTRRRTSHIGPARGSFVVQVAWMATQQAVARARSKRPIAAVLFATPPALLVAAAARKQTLPHFFIHPPSSAAPRRFHAVYRGSNQRRLQRRGGCKAAATVAAVAAMTVVAEEAVAAAAVQPQLAAAATKMQ
mmetsp:Transcript_7227/g.15775  ORF Transcript_7227/g.15775 Transcript_7227/m.15775 type:complete len:421 (-) Transcript_7227:1388-2650(-)